MLILFIFESDNVWGADLRKEANVMEFFEHIVINAILILIEARYLYNYIVYNILYYRNKFYFSGLRNILFFKFTIGIESVDNNTHNSLPFRKLKLFDPMNTLLFLKINKNI